MNGEARIRAHSIDACEALIGRFLLPSEDLLGALAGGEWERSPLSLVFHPAAEQPHPPIEPEREVVELLGLCLWDVFSDNHTVVDAAGTAYELGSFRGSGDFLAHAINRRYGEIGRRYDYIDFYMGTTLREQRPDLRPVYRWIFERLRAAGCDWRYSFPRMYLVDFGSRGADEDDITAYDPSEAVGIELEEEERKKEVRAFAGELDRRYRDAVERARQEPLPATVEAYRDVYRRLAASGDVM